MSALPKYPVTVASQQTVYSSIMPWLQEGVINDLVLLSAVGVRPVLVHGGGPEINIWLNKLGIEAQFKDGLRVTDGRHHAVSCAIGARLLQQRPTVASIYE